MSFGYKIEEHIATLSETDKGYSKELNLISYKDRLPTLDIRRWKRTVDGEQMFKGISLTDDEARVLRDALNKLDL